MKNLGICKLGLMLFLMFYFLGCSFELFEETKTKPAIANQQEYLTLLKATGEYTH
jgi:hypothetical protein